MKALVASRPFFADARLNLWEMHVLRREYREALEQYKAAMTVTEYLPVFRREETLTSAFDLLVCGADERRTDDVLQVALGSTTLVGKAFSLQSAVLTTREQFADALVVAEKGLMFHPSEISLYELAFAAKLGMADLDGAEKIVDRSDAAIPAIRSKWKQKREFLERNPEQNRSGIKELLEKGLTNEVDGSNTSIAEMRRQVSQLRSKEPRPK